MANSNIRTVVIGIIILVMAASSDLWAQPPGRGGGPSRGGDSGRGDSGRGGSSRGGPGGSGGFDPSWILRRMDRNQDGKIGPDEIEGRSRDFLQRFLGDDISKIRSPIPIDRLSDAVRRRMQSGGMSGSSRGGSNSSRGSQSSSADVEPLVPGFELMEALEAVPGFGSDGEKFNVKVSDKDLTEAKQTLGRYDSNRDGILDKSEIERGRWSDPPSMTDRNGDGKLSLSELALRYAVRRNARSGGSSSSSRSTSSSSSSRSGSSSSRGSSSRGSSDGRMSSMMSGIFSRYDSNKNGILEKSEWKNFRTDPSAADKNRDGRISKDELNVWMQSRWGGSQSSRGGDSSGGESRWGRSSSDRGGSSRSSSRDRRSEPEARQSYRVTSGSERLPDDLPRWFSEQDANGDGQVTMAEYSKSWTEKIVTEFTQFDHNGDGIITFNETSSEGASRTAPAESERGDRSDDERRTESREKPKSSSSSKEPSKKEPSKASAADSDKYLKFAEGYIKRYDTNKNGSLTKDEWSKMRRDYGHADENKDGKLTAAELAKAFNSR